MMPADFLWGAATCAYQIEGATHEDGRGQSIWDSFAANADIVSQRLGDRVHDWITHNEPWVVAWLGHATGIHAPGLADPALYPRVAHNLLLSHGEATPVVRGNVHGGAARVGITLNLSPVEPASERDEDERARLIRDGVLNRWYLDALFKGACPADILERQPIEVETGEMETIATPIDFLGVNYYSRAVVRMGPGSRPEQTRPAGEYTAMGWEVYPQGLYDLLTRIKRDYHPPALYVTENGAAFADEVGPDGAVHDPRRVAYLEAHVEQAARAIAAGGPLRGHFAWSLL